MWWVNTKMLPTVGLGSTSLLPIIFHKSVVSARYQFSSVPWLIRGNMRDDSEEILFQSFLLEAIVSSSGMGRNVHSLMLSIKHFLCWPQSCPPSKVPWRMDLEWLLRCVTCQTMQHGSLLPPFSFQHRGQEAGPWQGGNESGQRCLGRQKALCSLPAAVKCA